MESEVRRPSAAESLVMRPVWNYNLLFTKFLLQTRTVGTGLEEGAGQPPLPRRLITAWVCSYVREEERPLGTEKRRVSAALGEAASAGGP